MFDAWNFSEWIASIGAALFIFSLMTALSVVLGVVATGVFREKDAISGTAGLGQAANRGTGTRRAA